MNDLIKVNTSNENQALNKCQQILQDRREALASKAKRRDYVLHSKKRRDEFLLGL